MDSQSIIIIGGGLIGLSAAVELSALGYKIKLIEQNQYAGGRAYSFIDKKTGDMTDNCQHLMMGCYHSMRRYLRIIKSDNLVFLQPSLCIPFLKPDVNLFQFKCPSLPAPLHLLGGILKFEGISFKNRLEMLTVARQLFGSAFSKEKELDKISVEEWLTRLGQSVTSRKFLWDVITIGALNNHPKNVSALMLFRILREVFFGRRENSSLLIPLTNLNDIFVNPALNYIKQHGGKVLTKQAAAKIVLKGGKNISVLTQDKVEHKAEIIISAIPWYGLRRIFIDSGLNYKSVIKTSSGETFDWNRFKPSPIISIQLWLNKTVMSGEFAALLDTKIHWAFDKTGKYSDSLNNKKGENKNETKQHVSLVISGADEFIDLSNRELVAMAVKDLNQVMTDLNESNILHSLVIKEKRATFMPVPGLERLRPVQETSIPNFLLAGDWTDTGLPATIEGAILSGKKAADLINQKVY